MDIAVTAFAIVPVPEDAAVAVTGTVAAVTTQIVKSLLLLLLLLTLLLLLE